VISINLCQLTGAHRVLSTNLSVIWHVRLLFENSSLIK